MDMAQDDLTTQSQMPTPTVQVNIKTFAKRPQAPGYVSSMETDCHLEYIVQNLRG